MYSYFVIIVFLTIANATEFAAYLRCSAKVYRGIEPVGTESEYKFTKAQLKYGKSLLIPLDAPIIPVVTMASERYSECFEDPVPVYAPVTALNVTLKKSAKDKCVLYYIASEDNLEPKFIIFRIMS